MWSTSPERAPSMNTSRQNTGDIPGCPPMMPAETGPEPMGWWCRLGVIMFCFLWASASLALASTSSEQQGLFPAPSTQTPASLSPGDFSSSTSMQKNTGQSQEPQGLAGGLISLHPEVLTGPIGKRSAPGTPAFFHVVREGSDDKKASWWAGHWQSRTPFPLFLSKTIPLDFRSRLLPHIKTSHANIALNLKTWAMCPQKDHAKKFLAQINQMDNDSLTTKLSPSSQTPCINSLGIRRSTGGDKIDLRNHSLSTGSAPLASISEVELSMKSNSRVLSPPKSEVGFSLSSSKEALVSMGTHPSPVPSETSSSLRLPKEATGEFNATSFPSLEVSWGTETESHVPKLLRSFLFSHSPENPREQTISTTAIPAPSSLSIRSGLHSRRPKKVTSTSKDFSPTNPLAHIWISAIPPPTRPLEHSPSEIGQHERDSQVTGLRRLASSPNDHILQHDISTGRSRLLSEPATSPGIFESVTTTGMDVSSDLEFLLSLPPRALKGVKPKQGPSPVPTPKGPHLLARGNEETDSSTFSPETLRATSEIPQPVPTLNGEMPGTIDAWEPSTTLFPTSVSLYRSLRHIPQGIKTLQPGPGLDPPDGSTSSQPLLHVFTDASFPSGMTQDSGWIGEPKTFVPTPSLALFTETPLEAVPVASAKPQTSQVPVSKTTKEASRSTLNQASSQASCVASALQHQGSLVSTTELSHHSENSASARNSNPGSLGTRTREGEGTGLWTTQLFPAHARNSRSQAGGGRTKPSPFLWSLRTLAQLKTRATPKPLAFSQPMTPGSSKMPEEQMENVSEVREQSAALNQMVPTDLATFLPESPAKDSNLTPPTTWAKTLPSEQGKSQNFPTKRQEKIHWPPRMVSHPAPGALAHIIRRLGNSSSPFSLMTESLKGLTSPMEVPSQPGPTRKGPVSRWVLPISPQSTSGRDSLIDFPTSGPGDSGTALTVPTPVGEEGDPQQESEFLVHTVPLQFRLSQISYIPALANNQSSQFRRLKWEVTLTFRRMLSHVYGFQQFSILYFLNGSVFVQSEVEVEGNPPATSSDLIRCIVSMVHQKMDTYFSWKVDLPSLYSNGYKIENLEPERLLIAFMIPRLVPLVDKEYLLHLQENLSKQVMEDLEKVYPVAKFCFLDIRESQGKLLFKSEAYVESQTWADIPSVLQALIGLANQSVDLSSLTVADAQLDLQLLPISFLVINGIFEKSWLEPLSLEHQTLLRKLASAVKHALSSYSSLLQVVIHDCLNDSSLCLGELLFQAPGPKPADLLQTLMHAVDSDGHLAGSQFQVDPSSFSIAEENLEFPPGSKTTSNIPLVALILSFLSVCIAFFLIFQCVRQRRHGTYSFPQAQWDRRMFELESRREYSDQQEGSPALGMESQGLQATSEEDSGSSS